MVCYTNQKEIERIRKSGLQGSAQERMKESCKKHLEISSATIRSIHQSLTLGKLVVSVY